jgi:hypothetical protein
MCTDSKYFLLKKLITLQYSSYRLILNFFSGLKMWSTEMIL